MKNAKKSTIYIVQGAIIAALYAVLTICIAPLSFGANQFRIAEALTILPVFTPAAIPGLTIGCIIANLTSPFGIVDIICGSAATLLATICTRMTRNVCIGKAPFLSPLFPVLFNGVIVGLEIAYFEPGGISWAVFAPIALSVAFGELVVCYVLGIPLFYALDKTKIFKK